MATSSPAVPRIDFSRSVEVPESVLDNGQPEQRVLFRFTQQPRGDEVTRATLSIELTAEHSDPTPQAVDDNTPWLRAQELIEDASGAAGGPGGAGPTAPVAPFLRDGRLVVDVMLDERGQAQRVVQLSRETTSTPITTRVRWQVELTAQLPSDDSDNRVLPWDVEVLVEGGR